MVEVIILPYEKAAKHNKTVSNLRGKLCLTEQQYNDFQNDIQKAREEKSPGFINLILF